MAKVRGVYDQLLDLATYTIYGWSCKRAYFQAVLLMWMVAVSGRGETTGWLGLVGRDRVQDAEYYKEQMKILSVWQRRHFVPGCKITRQ